MQDITNNFRYNWSDVKAIITELKADGSKTFFKGSVLAALAYALQYSTAVVYSLFDFALFEWNYTNMSFIYHIEASEVVYIKEYTALHSNQTYLYS